MSDAAEVVAGHIDDHDIFSSVLEGALKLPREYAILF
jgi:hypothetical protein